MDKGGGAGGGSLVGSAVLDVPKIGLNEVALGFSGEDTAGLNGWKLVLGEPNSGLGDVVGTLGVAWPKIWAAGGA